MLLDLLVELSLFMQKARRGRSMQHSVERHAEREHGIERSIQIARVEITLDTAEIAAKFSREALQWTDVAANRL